MSALKLHLTVERWPLAAPFRITGYVIEAIDVLVLNLERDGKTGRGEAAGVYYLKDTPISMAGQIEAVRTAIEAGVTRAEIQKLLPPGGARNALDCALWDLSAKLEGVPVWKMAKLGTPRPLLTTFTCGADEPEKMANAALAFPNARAIKLKLTGEPSDADRVRAVRNVLKGVWLGVDANQGFTRESLEKLMPTLVDCRVALIEQPFPIGQEALLDRFESPIPIAADESAQTCADVAGLVGRFQVVNIKLDKCGGLTEGLAMARDARAHGLDAMVGNMGGTSLAAAPSFLLGQLCNVVDLDGPALLRQDRLRAVEYADGFITCPGPLWGGA